MDQIPFLKKHVATEIKGIAAIYIMLSHLVSSPWWWMGFFLFGGGGICSLEFSSFTVDMD